MFGLLNALVLVLVLDGGRDASEEPPGMDILEDIRNFQKEYPSIYKQMRGKDRTWKGSLEGN